MPNDLPPEPTMGAEPTIRGIREAAKIMRCTPDALRRRCHSAATMDDSGRITAVLGPGIVAFKFGRRQWRVRFEQAKETT